MKVVVSKYIPFHGFVAMAFFNILLWRKEYEYRMKDLPYFNTVYNHESIHEAQMRDFCPWIIIGGIVFYLIYLLEWLFRVLFTKDFMSSKAYKNISFEKEAYTYENNLTYLGNRKHFAQWRK